jgi:hypothetical protein
MTRTRAIIALIRAHVAVDMTALVAIATLTTVPVPGTAVMTTGAEAVGASPAGPVAVMAAGRAGPVAVMAAADARG